MNDSNREKQKNTTITVIIPPLLTVASILVVSSMSVIAGCDNEYFLSADYKVLRLD